MANSTTTGITTTAVTSEAMRSRPGYPMHIVPPKIYLKTLNPAITCNLCKGYLIDAMTIVECIHSFCHSCITMYLRKNPDCCPVEECKKSINQEKPNIKPDATLQAIVYKLVPGLYEKELLRRRAFYKIRTREALQATPEQRGDDTEHLIFGPNENISLMLEYSDADHSYRSSDEESSNSSHDISDHCEDDFEIQLRRPKYLQCPAIFTISNLKKFLLHKFSINPKKFCVEIMYKVKTINLPDYYTLMDVAYIFTWKRDAPMKFFYCVRAAHSPDANVDQNAVIYDPILSSNRFQNNSRLTFDSTDQEQSSDADSDVRSESTKRKPGLGTNGALLVKQRSNEQVNSTSNEDAIASSSTTLVKTEMPKTPSHSLNGSDGQRNDILDKIKKEPNLSPTTSSRSTNSPSIKTDVRRQSPEKQQSDRRTNGTSPKPNAFRFRIASDGKPSSSLSRTTSDSRDVKEKLKVKSSIDHMTTKPSDSSTSRFEQMNTPSTSEKLSSKFHNSKPSINIERPKNRLLFKKEDNSRSFSPPLSAENEYDFDQHLLKEKLSEKKKFLSSIHLTPRIHSTETPLVQLPKTPKTELNTNLSKDNKPMESNSTIIPTKLPASTSSASSASSVSAASSPALSGGIIKKPDNKASKRKSREPVKNVAQVKYSSPNERLVDLKWAIKTPTIATTSSATNIPSAITTTTTTSTSTNATNERLKDLSFHPNVPTNLKQSQNASHIANAMRKDTNNQTKASHSTSIGKSNMGKLSFSTASTSKTKSPNTFKTPTLNSLSKTLYTSSPSTSSPSTSSSETSFIINNVQRPNQADTPRPPMQTFKSPKPAQPWPISNYYRVFSNETSIQEIRSDDTGKVYGPTFPNSTEPANELSGLSLPNYPIIWNLNQRPCEIRRGNSPKLNTPPNALPIPNSRDSLNSTIHPNVQPFFKIPSELSVTVMDQEMESNNRSIFNDNVVNSIDILKIPNESGGEVNARFSSSIATSSPSNLIQTIEKQPPRTNSSVAINLSNNHKSSPSLQPLNNSPSYQAEYEKKLGEGNKEAKKPKPIKSNRPIQPQKTSTLENLDDISKEAQKRKLQQTNDGSAPNKFRKIQERPLPPSKSSPTTQRPIPDLVMAKDEKRINSSEPIKNSTSACTSSTNTISSTNSSISASSHATTKKVSPERKTQNSVTNATTLDKAIANALVRDQAKVNNDSGSPGKYLPFTSTEPFWKKHSTPDQLKSHKNLVENLSQNNKNSGTIVD